MPVPYLKIQTNREMAEDARQEILKKASVLVSKNLGKPEGDNGQEIFEAIPH